jgi:4a-hydroxytetrahydrobiopterin dehydratase
MNALPPDQITDQLGQHPDWRLENHWLARDIQFPDFVTAWQFMSHVAQCAEQQDHHPNWYNVYGTVQLRLSSHDAAGVTERDFRLAHSIDEYLAKVAHTNLPATPIFTP